MSRLNHQLAIRIGSTLCLSLALALPAAAQITLAGKSGSTTQTIVDEQRVIENLRSSFEVAAGDLFVDAQLGGVQSGRGTQLVATLGSEFHSAARLKINELKGDGVLDAGEVTSAIGKLRGDYLGQLEAGLDALARGYAPLPLRADYDSTLAHARALAEYTLTVRNDAGDWLALAGALAGGLVLAWLIARLLRHAAKALRNADRRWIARLTEGLVGPSYLITIVMALWVGFKWLWLPGVAEELVHKTVGIALIGAALWFVWHACDVLAHGLAWLVQKTYQTEFDRHVVVLVSRALRILALVLFVLLFVNGFLDSNLTGVIAGLGVLGVILSFLMRGTIENVAASFTIFGDKPFRIGDLIVYDGEWGKIEDIGFRSTRFRTLEGHLITIPNSRLIDDALHNVGARPSIRRRFRIGLTYDTPPEKVEQAIAILRELLTEHEGQPDGQQARVAFETYGDYALQLLVQYYYEPADYWQALDFDTRLNLDIKRRFADAGIELAFPSQSMYLYDADGSFTRAMQADRSNGRTGVAENPQREQSTLEQTDEAA